MKHLEDIGFAANRRLLDVQRVSHDCAVGAEAFEELHRPAAVDGQRSPALRFGDPRDLRETVAPLLELELDGYRRGRATYDLRRLRLRGLIERVPYSNRYAATAAGLRCAMCYHRVFARVMRPALSVVDATTKSECRLNRAIDSFDREVDRLAGNATCRLNLENLTQMLR